MHQPTTQSETRRRSFLLLAAGLAVPAVLGVAAAPATADPAYPSQGDVDAAKAAAEGVAGQVAALQVQLAGQQADLEASRTALSVAAEDYDEAQALLSQRTDEATAAAATAAKAQGDFADARRELGRLAAQRYRGNSAGVGPLAAVLAADGPQELIDRSATMDLLGAQRDDLAQRMDAARIWAHTSAESAATAQAQQQRATDAMAAARRRAADAAAAADALVASTSARTGELVSRLAALRQTSVDLEVQRQAGIEAERQARAEAAARAAAEA
ncbi:hypothetical protein F1544_11085, partial [Kineosporiaceae bacterium B12]